MSVFLIDYENLHTSAFGGLEDLTEEDRVLVFYTNNSDSLTFSLMQRLNAARAVVEYVKVGCGGKNSLDFQLCSYLGYLMGTHRDTNFCIVSRDKGFTVVLNFWEERAENGNAVLCGPSIRSCVNRNLSVDAELEKPVEEQTENEQSLTEQSTTEQSQTEQSTIEQPETEQQQIEQPQAEQPAEKPKRKYNRRAPYKRKPKAPAEQSA